MDLTLSIDDVIPAPQGSKTYIGRGRLIESCKRVKPYRKAVVKAGKLKVKNLISEPIEINLEFKFSRPKAHFDAYGKIRKSAPIFLTTKRGDIDKLCRSTLDGLTSSVIVDDSQVVKLNVYKRYCEVGERTGTNIYIKTL